MLWLMLENTHTHNIQCEFISFDCKINWESRKKGKLNDCAT